MPRDYLVSPSADGPEIQIVIYCLVRKLACTVLQSVFFACTEKQHVHWKVGRLLIFVLRIVPDGVRCRAEYLPYGAYNSRRKTADALITSRGGRHGDVGA